MRRLVLTLPVLAAGLACTSHPSVEPRPDAAVARLPLGDELAGRTVGRTTDGPWQVRTTRGTVGGGAEALSKSDDGAPAESTAIGLGGGAGGRLAGRGGAAPAKSPPAPESPASGAWEGGGGDGGPAIGGVLAMDADEADDAGSDDPPFEGPAAGEKRARLSLGDEPATGRGGAPAQQLKAGATDDNADYDAYLEFLATWVDRKNVQELYQPMDVSDRRFVQVVDVNGDPVPGAVVSIVDEAADRVLWTGTTYGDGRIPYYPRIDAAAAAVGATGPLLVEAFVRDAAGVARGVRAPWDGAGAEVRIALDDPVPLPDPIRLDVCFVIDTTGSMGDEIESIKQSLLKVTAQLRELDREFDLRYGAVLYRDIGDEYVTATHAFTEDIEAFDEALRGVQAAGGGDGPESLNQAVAQAVDGVEWRADAAKVAFLIADAPPHMDYAGDVPYGEGARAALARGIRMHAVAASGLDAVGTLVFRQIAQLTRGKFIFIEYGSPEASAASHGVTGAVKSNNLEDILFEQIRDEVARYGR